MPTTKELYTEALADARKVREVAVKDAQMSVLEALTPRIRNLVEEQLLGEESVEGPPRIPPGEETDAETSADQGPGTGAAMGDVAVVATAPVGPVSSGEESPCCADEGMVGVSDPVAAIIRQFELNIEGIAALQPLLEATREGGTKEIELAMYKLAEEIGRLRKANADLLHTAAFGRKITQMISGMENMYDYVQEVVSDPALKTSLSEKLETHYQELKTLREGTMKNRNRNRKLNEDAELDAVGGSEEGAGEETKTVSLNVDVPVDLADELVDSLSDIEIELDDEGGDDLGGEDDLGGDDLGGGEDDVLDVGGGEGEEEDELQLNSVQLSDDTIVEIDENMLRRELSRERKRLSEEGFPTPSADGAGVDSAAMDDFGGGADEGEPFSDLDVEADWPGARNASATTESTRADHDSTQSMTEMDEPPVAEGEGMEDEGATCESLEKKLAYEFRVQKAAKSKGAELKREGAKARNARNTKAFQAVKARYVAEAKRYRESVERAKQIKASLTEAKARGRSNSGSNADGDIRKKLAESNLNNVKLQYANKLLQTQLPNAKKLQIVEQLDEAKSPREAKLIFESSVKLLGSGEKPNNQRQGAGTASRATRSGSASQTTLNEGFEINRWSRLAGIK